MRPVSVPAHARRVVSKMMCVALLALPGLGAQIAQAADHPGTAKPVLVKVDKAWVRASVKGQSGTGGFMDLTASQNVSLIGFSTPVARSSELHEMAMGDGDVMRMRPVGSLALPAGQRVSLRPGMGGHHLMLMGLKRQLHDGDTIALTLRLRAPDGRELTQKILVPVKGGAAQDDPPSGAHR